MMERPHDFFSNPLSMHRKVPLLGFAASGLALTVLSCTCPTSGCEPEDQKEVSLHSVQGNVYTSSSQGQTALATASDGRTALVWESKRQERGTFGVYARLFDAVGQPLSHEFHVNTFLPKAQWHPAAAFSEDDTLWFAWESYSQDGSGAGLVARAFDKDGQPLGGELPINLMREGDQVDVALATAADGHALAVWSSHHPDPAHQAANGIRARLLNLETPDTAEVLISAPLDGHDRRPSVTRLDNGDFLLCWTRTLTSEGRSMVMAQRLDAEGATLGKAYTLAGDLQQEALEGVIASHADGHLAAAWMAPLGNAYAVMAQRLDTEGRPIGTPMTVATPDQGWLSGVTLDVAADGTLAVAYNQEGRFPEGDIFRPKAERQLLVQRFDAQDRAMDAMPQVLSGAGQLALPTGAQRLAWTADQRLLAAYEGQGAEGDGSAANLALLLPEDYPRPVAVELGEAQPAVATTDADMMAAIPPIWDPNFVPVPRMPLGLAAGADFGFEGVAGTGWTPPDPEMAVGPNHIVVMTNGEITGLDKTGNLLWTDLIEGGAGFWGGLGTGSFVFDPEACWDPHAQRFLAMANERTGGRSYFLLGVSKDDSPDNANDWWKYRFDVTALAGGDIDSPNMAVNQDHILLTADFFGPDKYLIYIIEKSSVLGGGAANTTSELISGTGQQSMGVPVVYDNDPNLYILQSTEFGSNNSVIIHAIQDPFGTYSRTTTTLSVPTYTYPNQPPQKGSTSRPFLFEPRFWSVAQRNGSLWAVHHVNNSRARVRWYEIGLNGWPGGGSPSLDQDGEIDLGGGIHTFFPSIHVDANDNVAVTFARSATNEYISMGRAMRAAGDPAGTMRPAQVVQTSTNAHTSGRWGDYSATQAEPSIPGTFWGHHEFNNGGTSSWRTWVARFVLRPSAFELSVPGGLNSGANNTFSVSGATGGARVYFTYSTTGTGIFEPPGIAAILSLENPVLIGSTNADGAGNASITRFIPGSASGLNVWLQAIENDHASNWMELTVN